MSSKVAAQVVALRNCFESLIVRSCMNPEALEFPTEADREFLAILQQLSFETNWIPTGEEGQNLNTSSLKINTQQAMPLAAGEGYSSGPKMSSRYERGIRGSRSNFSRSSYGNGSEYYIFLNF